MLTILFCHQNLKPRDCIDFHLLKKFWVKIFWIYTKNWQVLDWDALRSEWEKASSKTGEVQISWKLLNNLILKSSGIFIGFPMNFLKVQTSFFKKLEKCLILNTFTDLWYCFSWANLKLNTHLDCKKATEMSIVN